MDRIDIYRLDILVDGEKSSRLVAIVDETYFAGCIDLLCSKQTASVKELFVHPEQRRFGIATKLMEQCIEIAARSGCREMCLSLRRDNVGARNLYQKLGFEFGYSMGTKDDAWTLSLK